MDKMVLFLWVGVISGAALGTLAGTAVYCFNVVGAEIAVKTREEFVRAVLRNDATWHANEENRPAKLKARLEKSVLTLQAATSSQLNFALMGCGMFFFGLLIAFFYSWKLTLVFMIAIPLEMLGSVPSPEASLPPALRHHTPNSLPCEVFNFLRFEMLLKDSGCFGSRFEDTRSTRGPTEQVWDAHGDDGFHRTVQHEDLRRWRPDRR